MQLCKECGRHCLPIDLSEYVTKYFEFLNEDVIVPSVEVDNGKFKRLAHLSSATSSSLAHFYSLKSEIMRQVYASTLFFHSSTLYLIDIGIDLVLNWFKVIAAWNRFLALRDERCVNCVEFLKQSFNELVIKASKVKKKLATVLSDKGKEITEYATKIHSEVGRIWLYDKFNKLCLDEEDIHLSLVYELTSILAIFLDAFIGITLSVDQMLTNKRVIYSQGFTYLYLDEVDVLDALIRVMDMQPREVRVLKPELLTIAKMNIAKLGLKCKVY